MHSFSGYQYIHRVCSVTYRHEQRRVILFKSGSETTRSETRCKYDLSDGKVYAKAGMQEGRFAANSSGQQVDNRAKGYIVSQDCYLLIYSDH